MVVFLDFIRANGYILIRKLSKIELGRNVLPWFKSYLVNWRQKVKHLKYVSPDINKAQYWDFFYIICALMTL